MYNVFTDFHHAGLLNSLILLFEKRLSGAVYRPIGMEWAEKGFWKVYDHPATQQQFLGIGAATPDGTPPLNEVVGIVKAPRPTNPTVQWYNCKDIEGDKTNKAIDFENFLKLPVDIIIASIPAHVEPFKRLCELHPNHPKLIFQIGNAWTSEAANAKNIMASAIIDGIQPDVNFISYHQEFDTKVFYPLFPEGFGLKEGFAKGTDEYKVPDMPRKNIFSFINCFDTLGHFQEDWQLFQRMEQSMPEWNFKSFGGQCRDGSMDGSVNLANKMQEARFIWHTKNGGDGYGHVLHNTAAVGRPLIVKKNYYNGKMGERLLVDGTTCIAIDGLSTDEIINKINYYSEPNRYAAMATAVYANFQKVCDFDLEFKGLQNFLEKLL